jgi:peptidoglycan/LPS O-acetylase OafA/YrhL
MAEQFAVIEKFRFSPRFGLRKVLGTLRFVLAMLVVMNHLWLPTSNKVGAHAVIGFYTISGYLMTKVVCEVYRGKNGFIRYCVNRFLRIFPLYWVVLLSTAAALALFPSYFGSVHGALRLPSHPYEWFQNFTLIDLVYADVRLVPPAWSLSVELVFYGLIGLGLSRRLPFAAAWWLGSLAYTGFLLAQGATFGERYTPPYAASVFFSTGAMLYHVAGRFGKGRYHPLWLLCGIALFAVSPLLIELAGGDLRMEGYYGPYLLFLPVLAWTLSMRMSSAYMPVDRFLGDMAYPVFLTHFFTAGTTNVIVGNGLVPRGTTHFVASTFVCLILSAALVLTVDRKVNRLRTIIRPSPR